MPFTKIKSCFKIAVIFFFLGIHMLYYPGESLYGQTKSDSLKLSESNSSDLIGILGIGKKNSLLADTTTIEGPGPFLSVVPVVGYALSTGFTGALVNNISFYTSAARDKLSSVQTSFFYSQYNQYWMLINSNIFFKKIKTNLTGDWRAYCFPTNTFGLGSNTDLNQPDKISYYYIKIHQLFQHEFFHNTFFGIGYDLDNYWNIKEFPPSSEETDFQRYGLTNQSCSSGLSLDFLFDDRTNSVNPDKGNFVSLEYRQNRTFLGSDGNWQSLLLDLRKYINFPENTENVLALWSYNYFTFSGKPPYLDLPSTGWDAYNNTGRGYTQGRYRGPALVDIEGEYRFPVTNNGLFGAVVFVNAESVAEWPSYKFDEILPGYGAGIRIKVNKHSKANLAIDYGIGTQGSRGFFFNLGEVF